MVNNYIPHQGDIVLIDFAPQSGHEQSSGRRPALVISNETFNSRTKLALLCPIANTDRGFPLHVRLDDRTNTTGVIMCEQLKSLDFSARNEQFKEKVPLDILEDVINKAYSIIERE